MPTTQGPRKRSLDPEGKGALFGAPVQAAPDHLRAGEVPSGRQALFSVGPRQPGTVVVDCAGCRAKSRIRIPDVGVRLAQLSAWIPGRRHAHWMRCPSCNHRTWCHIGWTE